jgi:hypothetical protein
VQGTTATLELGNMLHVTVVTAVPTAGALVGLQGTAARDPEA